MNPFGTRGRAQRLEDLLQDGAASPSSARDEVALVERLRGAGEALGPGTAPRAEFRAGLRTRLLAVAAVQPAPVAAGPPPLRSTAVSWSTSRRAGALAAGMTACVVAVTGVAVAGSQSLPGDPFYGVKGATEALRLRVADGDVAKGTRHLEVAATRLQEVRGLMLGRDAVGRGPEVGTSALGASALGASALGASALGTPGVVLASATSPADPATSVVATRVTQTLTAMDEQTLLGQSLLTSAFRETQAREPLLALSRFATRQGVALEQLLDVLPIEALPVEAWDRAFTSLTLIEGVEDDAGTLLEPSPCSPECDPAPQVGGGPTPQPSRSTSPAPSPAVPGPTASPSPTAPSPRPASPAPSPAGSPPAASPSQAPAPSVSEPPPAPPPVRLSPSPTPLPPLPPVPPLPPLPPLEPLVSPAPVLPEPVLDLIPPGAV